MKNDPQHNVVTQPANERPTKPVTALAVQLLGPGDYRLMPWKNGLGTTTEIAIHPPGAGLAGQPFDWRVSMAAVTADGEFSRFPGYERSILVAEGAGMELDFDAAPTARLDYPGAMTEFSGDWCTRSRLLDGPVRDFNVMTARGRVQQYCLALNRAPVEFIWEPPTETLLFYCIRGTLILKIPELAEWNLERDQCLLIPAGQPEPKRISVMAIPHTRDTLAAAVRFNKV